MSITEQERIGQLDALRRERETLETRIARANEKLERGVSEAEELRLNQLIAEAHVGIEAVEREVAARTPQPKPTRRRK